MKPRKFDFSKKYLLIDPTNDLGIIVEFKYIKMKLAWRWSTESTWYALGKHHWIRNQQSRLDNGYYIETVPLVKSLFGLE